jgi:hypothetical protein
MTEVASTGRLYPVFNAFLKPVKKFVHHAAPQEIAACE